jgi:hypothetical protein
MSASLDVATQVGDLVFSSAKHGGGIIGPASGEDVRYLLIVDSSNTLNNSAGATKLATGALTTMSWTFFDTDELQLIDTVLRPAP